MEVFSRILVKASSNGRCSHHPRCAKLDLAYLCFADDLLLFCQGDLQSKSSSVIKESFDSFSALSWLSERLTKTNFSVLGEDTKHYVENLFGFKEGTLPIKFLGVPLISTRLTARDCRSLIDKITNMVESWTSKRLSYAGRLQLIKLVLFSIQVYWSSIFILPKEVCKIIDQILISFLWHGAVGISKAAKVAWNVVCLPREEGGLSFLDSNLL
ncbi:hypothetical protein L3X38_026699 [Prunus dulcis]|uniref:Reverse transcriptase domain-containing protein n=1 Tax=Prunus dulcis TaxID=3755 RepID=A0AAD4VLN6_PRUDU|nr:hypothetical protein L3X38_026699 [Prunus dulcis]